MSHVISLRSFDCKRLEAAVEQTFRFGERHENSRTTQSDEGRRHFIGGSDARVIMGQDEKALIRLWQEKRGEVGLRAASSPDRGTLDRLLALLPESDAGTATILFEELDSSLTESVLDFLSSVSATAKKTILGLKPSDCGDRDACSRRQLLLGPSKKRPSDLDLTCAGD